MENRIAERRKELGMLQSTLATLAGLNKSTISRYESQQIERIPYLNLVKIANALRCTPETLCGGEAELVESSIEEEMRVRFSLLSPSNQKALLHIAKELL